MKRIRHQLLAAIVSCTTRPRWTLAITLVTVAMAIVFSSARLRISADQNKLFDPRVPFFRDYLHFVSTFPENEAVYVVVRARRPDALPAVQRWGQIADAIAERVAGLKDEVRAVDARVPIDKLGTAGLLFDDPLRVRQSVKDIRRFIPLIKLVAEHDVAKSLLLGGTPIERLLSALATQKPDSDTARFISALSTSWNDAARRDGALKPGSGLPDLASLEATDPSRLGYYYVPDQADPSQHLLLVRVYPKSQLDSLTAISKTVEAIQAAALEAAAPFSEFSIGLTGRPALDADEMRTTDRDSRRAEILALLFVFLGLTVALRSIWLALAGEIALGVGIAWTFGWATLSLGELNLLSIVFLLALIGIGMDYLVQILTRYRREAARRTDPRRLWIAVFRHVSAPINTACLGAASAFLVSIFTDFRGAADLGIIAGGGLLLCLLSGYIVLPALLTICPPRTIHHKGNNCTTTTHSPRPQVKRSWRSFAFPVAWCALLAVGASFASRPRFNADLLSLQAPDHDSVRLIRHLQTWSAVVLSKDLQTLGAVRSALSGSPLVQSTESILTAYENLDFLRVERKTFPTVDWTAPATVEPSAISRIARKAGSLAEKFSSVDSQTTASLNRFAELLFTTSGADRDRLARRLSDWQVGFTAQLFQDVATFTPDELNVDSLPEEMRSHFVGSDGKFALYIYPSADLWEQPNLIAFARDVQSRVASVANAPAPTGIAMNLYGSTASIQRSFVRATIYALALIVLLVLLDFRKIGRTLMALSVLAFGLPMLLIIMGLFGVDWNFANFFALPILIGAGHEYGVFLVHRYAEAEDRNRFWPRWDVSDGALLLCAYVTCTSFGFFWFTASHRGLRSLGLVMTLGTACIYLASVAVLRPLLRWRLARSVASQPEQASGPLHR